MPRNARHSAGKTGSGRAALVVSRQSMSQSSATLMSGSMVHCPGGEGSQNLCQVLFWQDSGVLEGWRRVSWWLDRGETSHPISINCCFPLPSQGQLLSAGAKVGKLGQVNLVRWWGICDGPSVSPLFGPMLFACLRGSASWGLELAQQQSVGRWL